jgi:hypothetical protein
MGTTGKDGAKALPLPSDPVDPVLISDVVYT